MDDGATPVEHGGAPAPAPNPKFHKFSSRFVCLMSAFQHQKFHENPLFMTNAKIRILTILMQNALILTYFPLKFGIF